jgi:hypothetical protein
MWYKYYNAKWLSKEESPQIPTENYSSKSHLERSIKYKIIGPNNPSIEEKPVPIIRFITNTIPALPQNAKNAHFFHINKKIVNIVLRSANTPRV